MEIKLSDMKEDEILSNDFISHNALEDEKIYEEKQKKSFYFKIALSLFYVLILTVAFIVF